MVAKLPVGHLHQGPLGLDHHFIQTPALGLQLKRIGHRHIGRQLKRLKQQMLDNQPAMSRNLTEHKRTVGRRKCSPGASGICPQQDHRSIYHRMTLRIHQRSTQLSP